jgi:hypothetical protein
MPSQNRRNRVGIVAYHIGGTNNTFIEFSLPDGYDAGDAMVGIYNAKGCCVRTLSQKVLGSANHVVWDETDLNSTPVSRGTYIAELVSGQYRGSVRFTIVK